MPDSELKKLIDATKIPSQTNCWYAVYRTREWVREIAECELRVREAARRATEQEQRQS